MPLLPQPWQINYIICQTFPLTGPFFSQTLKVTTKKMAKIDLHSWVLLPLRGWVYIICTNVYKVTLEAAILDPEQIII